jgi:hypothetical protein
MKGPEELLDMNGMVSLLVWECGCDYFFKVFFTRKCIKIIFFYFLKIIFNISASKLSKNTKKY